MDSSREPAHPIPIGGTAPTVAVVHKDIASVRALQFFSISTTWPMTWCTPVVAMLPTVAMYVPCIVLQNCRQLSLVLICAQHVGCEQLCKTLARPSVCRTVCQVLSYSHNTAGKHASGFSSSRHHPTTQSTGSCPIK